MSILFPPVGGYYIPPGYYPPPISVAPYPYGGMPNSFQWAPQTSIPNVNTQLFSTAKAEKLDLLHLQKEMADANVLKPLAPEPPPEQTDLNNTGSKAKDPFKHTALRYAGYANELAETYKEFLSKSTYKAGYIVTDLYVYADAVSQFIKGYNSSTSTSTSGKIKDGLKSGLDTYGFQAMASQYGPVLIVERLKKLTYAMAQSFYTPKNQPKNLKMVSNTIALATVLLSVPLIDKVAQGVMNLTIRPLLGLPKTTTH